MIRSPWTQLIRTRPSLLLEPSLSSRDNSFSLVEETFEKFGWIPSQYARLTSERFMERYCWALGVPTLSAVPESPNRYNTQNSCQDLKSGRSIWTLEGEAGGHRNLRIVD